MTADVPENGREWSREEDKAFENALATYPEDSLDRWEKILGDVGGKSLEEIKHHYELLVDDVNRIESGSVPLPRYNSRVGDEGIGKKGGNLGNFNSDSIKGSRSDQERRKGLAWTEDEHRLVMVIVYYGFLMWLDSIDYYTCPI